MASAPTEHDTDKLYKDALRLFDGLTELPANFDRFRYKPLPGVDRTARFHVCLRVPQAEGGTQRICRQESATLSLTLRESTSSRHNVWFWLAQLVHYGLYKRVVKSLSKRKVIHMCRNIFELALQDKGCIVVPRASQDHERRLQKKWTAKKTKRQSEESHFKDKSIFTARELQILHHWRDDFCRVHHMSRAELPHYDDKKLCRRQYAMDLRFHDKR